VVYLFVNSLLSAEKEKLSFGLTVGLSCYCPSTYSLPILILIIRPMTVEDRVITTDFPEGGTICRGI